MNVKQFKRRWLNHYVEPELFYMPFNKKKKIKTLSFSMTSYRVHTSTYESSYHGYGKTVFLRIGNTNMNNLYPVGGNILFNNNVIGEAKYSGEQPYSIGGTNYYIRTIVNTEIYPKDISYYGVGFLGTSSSDSITNIYGCNNHKPGLSRCIKTARPYCQFGEYHIDLSSLINYDDISNGGRMTLLWFVFYDCKDNAIKSYISIVNRNNEKFNINKEIEKAYNGGSTTIYNNFL